MKLRLSKGVPFDIFIHRVSAGAIVIKSGEK